VFGSRRAALLTLTLTASSLAVLGGFWHNTGDPLLLNEVSGERAQVWYRIALVLPGFLLVVGRVVLWIFEAGADRVARLERATTELEARRSQHEAETEALVGVETMRGRAERTATVGRLTGTVAHDLNNSLMALSGWADLLKGGDFEEALENLRQAANHAEALIQSLRPAVHVTHHGPGIDLAEVLERAEPLLDAVWDSDQGKLVRLQLELQSGAVVAIHEQSFKRLLINLVSNARQALGDGAGVCHVRVGAQKGCVELSVRDNGPGMDTATRARIFEPFFSTKGERGTGLGLLSVKEIVEATSGVLSVTSQPGSGTEITIKWPRAELAQPQRGLPVSNLRQTGSARILLAEDDPLVRGLLARGLRSRGFEVVEAPDGDSALQKLEEFGSFDVLCTDAVMPGCSIDEVIQTYQTRNPNGPVLLISGYLPEELSELATRRGVNLLSKPFSCEVMALELDRLLQTDSEQVDERTMPLRP
jgi:signal transduction histidine kinase/ActR/RegA family two-component response regulator